MATRLTKVKTRKSAKKSEEAEKEYKIKDVLEYRYRNGKKEYHIEWEIGGTDWVPVKNLSDKKMQDTLDLRLQLKREGEKNNMKPEQIESFESLSIKRKRSRFF